MDDGTGNPYAGDPNNITGLSGAYHHWALRPILSGPEHTVLILMAPRRSA